MTLRPLRFAALALALAALVPALVLPGARAADTGPTGRILVDSATYGASCGQKDDNAIAAVRTLCDGQPRCEVALDAAALIGTDPAPACDKDLAVRWSCNGALPGRNTILVMPETGLAVLACKSLDEPPPAVAEVEPDPAQPDAPLPELLPLPEPTATELPPGGVRLRVDQATYGGNCGAPAGNATRPLSEACDGRDACSYVADRAVLGDPAPGCAKDLVVRWSCPGEAAGTRTFAVAPEAGLGSIVALACPVSETAANEEPPAPPTRPCDGSFNGRWATNLGQLDLAVDGDVATGSYPGGGSIEGTVQGRVLDGTWSDAKGNGTMVLTLADDGRRFDGSWTRDGGSGAWHGSCLMPPAPATLAATAPAGPIRGFAWVGIEGDFVGMSSGAPDGAADGHFRLGLDIGQPPRDIRSITVRSSDATGGSFGDLAWDTADPQRPLLGAVFRGELLRRTHTPNLGGFQGAFTLDLYVGDPEGLEPGQHLAVELTTGDGALYRKLTQIEPGAAPVAAQATETTTPAAAAGAPLEPDTDRPGADFMDFAMPEAEPALCRAACLAAPGCVAWTFVKPGLSGPQAHCWLKTAVPAAVSRDCCVSGVIGE